MFDALQAARLSRYQRRWLLIWLTLAVLGTLAFAIGVHPDIFGLDRSPVVGFVQVGVWLFGLAVALLSLYAAVRLIRNGRTVSLRAEIGTRLIATGYVLAAASSLADFIGIGSHVLPGLYFGPLQSAGLILGIVISLMGVILYWPWLPRREGESADENRFREEPQPPGNPSPRS